MPITIPLPIIIQVTLHYVLFKILKSIKKKQEKTEQ